MVKQKESLIYLNFFRQNLLLIITPALVLILAAGYCQTKLPGQYLYKGLFEIEKDGDVSGKVAQTDETVTLVRSVYLQKNFGIPIEDRVVVYKPGPLALEIEVDGPNDKLAAVGYTTLKKYILANYQFQQIGEDFRGVKDPPRALFLAAAFFIGILLGLVASLIKTYLQNF